MFLVRFMKGFVMNETDDVVTCAAEMREAAYGCIDDIRDAIALGYSRAEVLSLIGVAVTPMAEKQLTNLVSGWRLAAELVGGQRWPHFHNRGNTSPRK